MTPLAQHIAGLIAGRGPIGIDDYMALCLGHPEHGYYRTRDPLGRRGDFITAPEISQMFGELIGLWCADYWLRSGRPASVTLVELGPGRGTLMADAHRAAGAIPGFLDAVSIHLVETSPVLRAAQAATLNDVPAPTWHDELASLPDSGPLLVIANEFFDALPIRQFIRTDRGWCARRVGLTPEAGTPRFMPVVDPDPSLDPETPGNPAPNTPIGSIIENSPASETITRDLARRISHQGGAALIIDYGHTQSTSGDTLQAVRAHQYADPFDAPGEADLTAHVDFAALARAAQEQGARVHGPVTQGQFLHTLGIEARAARLKARATTPQDREIDLALHRLTAPDQMGRLFKALALSTPGGPTPAGFPESCAPT